MKFSVWCEHLRFSFKDSDFRVSFWICLWERSGQFSWQWFLLFSICIDLASACLCYWYLLDHTVSFGLPDCGHLAIIDLSWITYGCPIVWCCWLSHCLMLTCCPVLPIATSLSTVVPLRFLCLAAECKPCTKPGHICHPDSGECVCPPNTEGPRCERCVTDAYDFNNTKGCKVGAERCGSW